MVDIPGDNTTNRSIAVGGSISDSIEVVNDHDWIAITLTAGQSITVSLTGGTLVDPYLRILNSSGALLFENDDITSGSNRNSSVSFTASYSGTYYIDVAAWVPPPSSPDYPGYTGTYTVSVTNYSPPPVGTNDQIANQLVETYWGGNDHHFNVTQGGNITVNLTALTPEGQNLARNALSLWGDVIGVTFSEVGTGGQMEFDDNESGAYSTGVWGGGITSSAHVNVSTQWLTDYGTSLTSYSFQAYIHEIGHALGLGHAGNYNDTARYPYDASFQNDSWATSIMSYFDQRENTYTAGQGFTLERVVTPMVADIIAMSTLYGLSTTTRAGDTTYGFNNTSGRAIYDANQYPNVAYTIFDSGGIDTLDYSGFTGNQVINLNPETFGNFGNGNVGNLVIARGTVIENAIGGSGNDTLVGNSADNVLTGGAGTNSLTGDAGSDTFRDTIANLSGDTITDFGSGDRIVFTNAAVGSFSFTLTGNTLNFSGGSLTLTGFGSQLQAAAAPGGGVMLTVAAGPAPANFLASKLGDFNGDGRSDILWRNDNGQLIDWLGTPTGGFADNGSNSFNSVSTSWSVAGIGDFNGDGRDDILWRHSNGQLINWLGTSSGGFSDNGGNSFASVATNWSVAGIGDFNGDGRDDILWRHSNGQLIDWLGGTNGGFADNGADSFNSMSTTWSVAGIGDFNGDGCDDILWRNSNGQLIDWLGKANGGFTDNGANSFYTVSTAWSVAVAGDFNGDGRDDILWRHSNGQMVNWLGTISGGFADNGVNSFYTVSPTWSVDGVGDINGDGRDDILWRHADGQVIDWLGNINGGFTDNGANSVNWVSNDWHIQATLF